MNPYDVAVVRAPSAVLHGGSGLEVTLLEYLFRALFHLLAFGGVAVLVLRGAGAIEAAYSAFATERDSEPGGG